MGKLDEAGHWGLSMVVENCPAACLNLERGELIDVGVKEGLPVN